MRRKGSSQTNRHRTHQHRMNLQLAPPSKEKNVLRCVFYHITIIFIIHRTITSRYNCSWWIYSQSHKFHTAVWIFHNKILVKDQKLEHVLDRELNLFYSKVSFHNLVTFKFQIDSKFDMGSHFPLFPVLLCRNVLGHWMALPHLKVLEQRLALRHIIPLFIFTVSTCSTMHLL